MNLTIKLVPEYRLLPKDINLLRKLLDKCFPDTFESRIYFKQLPHFRLIMREDSHIIGQAGLDFRIILVGKTHIAVVGIIDLCITEKLRHQGFGTRLLKRAEKFARYASADFLVLMADRHDIYKRTGFIDLPEATTTWLAIEDRKSYGLVERDMTDVFLVKPVMQNKWPKGPIDMLGYLY